MLNRYSRILVAMLNRFSCGRCSFGNLGCCSCRVRVCVGVVVLFAVGVCVCDLLIFFLRILVAEPQESE